MPVLYSYYDNQWNAFCTDMPNITGVGIDPDEALQDLTSKINAVVSAVMRAQNNLCTDIDRMVVSERYKLKE